MRITVFGATGPTGLLLIDQALAQGHEVVAYARTPAKLPSRSGLIIVEGQLADAAAIARAIEGSVAVLSLLGPSGKKEDAPPVVTGTRNIVAAMSEHGVKRLVAMGTPSAADPFDRKDLRVGLMVTAIRKFKPAAFQTIVSVDRVVRKSGLRWTIVRFPVLTNGPRTAGVNARRVGDKGNLRLSRANAAAYFLDQLTDETQIGRAPFVTDN
ncbi:NAD(P)H-binding protein [Streptomyces sp. NPDC049916]|uniref:NAD(P)H-binding protein n=1 Tax=Streptomyces sp. NPDC049916 TaxID=3155156 RepID=UPI003431BB24